MVNCEPCYLHLSKASLGVALAVNEPDNTLKEQLSTIICLINLVICCVRAIAIACHFIIDQPVRYPPDIPIDITAPLIIASRSCGASYACV